MSRLEPGTDVAAGTGCQRSARRRVRV